MKKRKKYLITLYVDYYDYDGLTSDFAVEYETYDLADARQKILKLGAKKIDSELKEESYKNMELVPYPKGKIPILKCLNAKNKIVDQSILCLSDNTAYNNNYYYYDIIEIDADTVVDERLFTMGYREYQIMKFFDLFVAFILNKNDDTYQLYLVNPAARRFNRITELFRGRTTEEDKLLQVSRVTQEVLIGPLPSHAYLFLGEGNWRDVDRELEWELDFYQGQNRWNMATRLFRVPAYRTKYEPCMLNEINRLGMKLEWHYGRRNDSILYNPAYLRKTGEGKLIEVFPKHKRDVLTAVTEAVKLTDSRILRVDYSKGEILAKPDIMKSLGQGMTVLAKEKLWLLRSSDIAVYFLLTELGQNRTRLEIAHVYADAAKQEVQQKYQYALMRHVQAALKDQQPL